MNRVTPQIPDGYAYACTSCRTRHGPKLTGPRELQIKKCSKCEKAGKVPPFPGERKRKGIQVGLEKFR